MRYVWGHLRAFIHEDFSPLRYGLAALWIGLLTMLNYAFDIESRYIGPLDGAWLGFGRSLALYGLAYVPLLLPVSGGKMRLVPAALAGLLILTTDVSLALYRDLVAPLAGKPYYAFAWKVTQQLQSLLTILTPLAALYVLLRPMPGFYGITLGRQVRLGPYGALLALMLVPVALAATTSGFQGTYPTWQHVFAWPEEWRKVLGYELAYGWDFVATELLFRGFFVIALARLGGARVVLPATALYCSLHFGKPVGECVSSIFGGYLLGAMAYRTGNIWGGIIVHIGIAMLMDVFALVMR